ncbi:hypothetical protein PsAD26_02525 [Pseudovibrio sp. Ad26]|nr:hypothetical protein PsAD26_02525 [Pseudovibrio sp. Ad26]
MRSEDNNRDVKIESTQDFCKALSFLLEDPTFPEENIRTVAFIEAMQAWLEAFEGRNSLFDEPSDRYVTWADLYKLLQAAAIYE